VAQVLDGGRAFNAGIRRRKSAFNGAHVPNSQRNAPPQTILAPSRKPVQRSASQVTATWKIWAIQKAHSTRAPTRKSAAGLLKETWPKTLTPHSPPAITLGLQRAR